MAAKCGRVPVVRVLLEAGADPNETDIKGLGALHHAILTNVVENVQMLVTNKRTKIDLQDQDEATPLVLAAKMSHADTTSLQLLLDHSANAALADMDGKKEFLKPREGF